MVAPTEVSSAKLNTSTENPRGSYTCRGSTSIYTIIIIIIHHHHHTGLLYYDII
jgi:hypothetical protein